MTPLRFAVFARGVMVSAAGLALAACTTAPRPPIPMSAEFAPRGGISWAHSSRRMAMTCHVALGDVRDTRANTETMGELGYRYIHNENPRAWTQAALETLGQDGRFRFDKTPSTEPSALNLQVELIQAYMSSWSTTKSAVVVLRVRYVAGAPAAGAPTPETPVEEKIFRGDLSQMNWAGTESEAQDGLNEALKQAVAAVDDDIIARCGLDRPGNGSRPQPAA